MSAPNGWPDSERPGVPENPERDGWHWVLANSTKGIVPEAACWRAPRSRYPGMWFFQGNENYLVAEQMTQAHGWRGYLGPCLAPAEVAAREQAAYQQGWGDREDDFIAGTERSGLIVMAPGELAAREAAAAEAMRDGMEAAAKWHDEQAAYCSKRAAERMAEGHRSAHGALRTVQATHENSAAALRAMAEEAGDE